MIIENNKKIADFLNWEKVETFNYITPYVQNYLTVSRRICQTSIFRQTDLKFHTSWDWLIPVIEKIKSIPNKEKFGMLKYEVDVILDVPNIRIVQSYKIMIGDKSNDYFDIIEYENNFITNVYNAVLKFIDWYNKNNK